MEQRATDLFGVENGHYLRSVQCVDQLGALVERIERNDDQPGFGERIFEQDPMGMIRSPDGYPVARYVTARQQGGGETCRTLIEFAIRPAQFADIRLAAVHQRFAIGPALGGSVQSRADR